MTSSSSSESYKFLFKKSFLYFFWNLSSSNVSTFPIISLEGINSFFSDIFILLIFSTIFILSKLNFFFLSDFSFGNLSIICEISLLS